MRAHISAIPIISKGDLLEHNSKLNRSTKNKAPFTIIYYEAYTSMADAKYREKNLKRFAKAHTQLKRRVINSLK